MGRVGLVHNFEHNSKYIRIMGKIMSLIARKIEDNSKEVGTEEHGRWSIITEKMEQDRTENGAFKARTLKHQSIAY